MKHSGALPLPPPPYTPHVRSYLHMKGAIEGIYPRSQPRHAQAPAVGYSYDGYQQPLQQQQQFQSPPLYGGIAPATSPGGMYGAEGGSGMIAPIEMWLNSFVGNDVDTDSSDQQLQRLTTAFGNDGIIEVRRHIKLCASADELARDPSKCVVQFEPHQQLQKGGKYVPLGSYISLIQNTAPFPLALHFSDNFPMNAINLVPAGEASAHYVLPAFTNTVRVDDPIYTCDPAEALDFRRFNNWHKMTKEMLEKSVIPIDKGDKAPNNRFVGALVRVQSPLFDMIRPEIHNLGLIEGHNFVYRDYAGIKVAALPVEVVTQQLERGKQIIETLPFRDPTAYSVTFSRCDGESFSNVSNLVGTEVGRDVIQDLALNGKFHATVQVVETYKVMDV